MAASVAEEWAFSAGGPTTPTVDIDQLHFLMKGYLHVMEEKAGHSPYGVYVTTPTSGTTGRAVHSTLVSRVSDTAIRGSWKRRWCVLSQTPDGVHLVYYKHQTSFANCEPPVGVVFMDGCEALYTIPTHPKSSHTFSVTFPNRTLLLYPDKEDELRRWLEALETALNLQDGSAHSPLKGLPKQKAERKDLIGGVPHPHEQEVPYCHGDSRKTLKEVTTDTPDFGDTSAGSKVTVVSYKQLSEDEVDYNSRQEHARHDSVPNVTSELDSEGGPVQFMGFRTLDT